MALQETSIFFQKNRHRHYFLCHYLPLCSGIDTVSRSLLKFKRGAQPDLDNWIGRALQAFRETQPPLPPATIIIRALRHKETQPSPDPPSPLDLLGLALSNQLHFPYLPELLRKTRVTALNQSLTRHQRLAELENIYQVNPITPQTPSSILLIDDILTTGATVLSILEPLHTTFPTSTFSIFTLAKTD